MPRERPSLLETKAPSGTSLKVVGCVCFQSTIVDRAHAKEVEAPTPWWTHFFIRISLSRTCICTVMTLLILIREFRCSHHLARSVRLVHVASRVKQTRHFKSVPCPS